MQGKNTGHMPSCVCDLSMNKSIAPVQYKCKALHQSSLHENVVFSVCSPKGNATYIIFIMFHFLFEVFQTPNQNLLFVFSLTLQISRLALKVHDHLRRIIRFSFFHSIFKIVNSSFSPESARASEYNDSIFNYSF